MCSCLVRTKSCYFVGLLAIGLRYLLDKEWVNCLRYLHKGVAGRGGEAPDPSAGPEATRKRNALGGGRVELGSDVCVFGHALHAFRVVPTPKK